MPHKHCAEVQGLSRVMESLLFQNVALNISLSEIPNCTYFFIVQF